MSHHYQREPYIHKHIHYHYHYDINQNPIETEQRYAQSRIRSPKNKNYQGQFDSWKNHINPQVTRLYEEMSDSSTSQNSPNPRVSSYINPQYSKESNFLTHSNIESPRLSQSRQRLLQNIEEYEEYLKKRPSSTLYIPSTVSFIQSQYPQNQKKRYLQNLQQNQKDRKTLDDFISKKANSKIFNTYESTTAKDQKQENETDSQSYSIVRKNLPQFTLTAKSEIKNPQRHFIVENSKMQFSHINSQQNEPKDMNEIHNFSLFQKQSNQESMGQASKNQWPKYYPSDQSSEVKNLQENSNYRYELMKEECEYLRNKFIEHVEVIHNIKF